MLHSVIQSAQLSVLLLLLLSSLAVFRVEASEQNDNTSFTPAQLARASERLAQLYDDSMDADKDGKLTEAELVGWLANVADREAEADLEVAWKQLNLTDNTVEQLDWDTYAASRMGHSASSDDAVAEAEKLRLMQDELRRVIEEASRETGLDKTGIRVSLPGPTTKEEKKKENDEAAHHQQPKALPEGLEATAVQLARDRRRWEAADEDGDGRLSRMEFRDFALANPIKVSKRMRRVLAAEALERLDADGDGRVSEAEFLGAGGPSAGETATAQDEEVKNFRQLWDADKSGQLDLDEMEKVLETLETPGAVVGSKEPEEELRESEAKELVKAADTDGDGSLSRAEVTAALEAFAASVATNYGDSVGIHDEL